MNFFSVNPVNQNWAFRNLKKAETMEKNVDR